MRFLNLNDGSKLAIGSPDILGQYLRHFSCLAGKEIPVNEAVLRFKSEQGQDTLPDPQHLSHKDALNYVEFALNSRLALRHMMLPNGSESYPQVEQVESPRCMVVGFLCGMDDSSFVDFLNILPVLHEDIDFAYFFARRDFHFFTTVLGFDLPPDFGVVSAKELANDSTVRKLAMSRGLWQQSKHIVNGREQTIEGLILIRALKKHSGASFDLSQPHAEPKQVQPQQQQQQLAPQEPQQDKQEHKQEQQFIGLEKCRRPKGSRECSFDLRGLEQIFKFFASLVNSRPGASRSELIDLKTKMVRRAEERWLARKESLVRNFELSQDKCPFVAQLLPSDVSTRFAPIAFLEHGRTGIVLRARSLRRNTVEILKITADDFYAFDRSSSELETAQTAARRGLGPDIYEFFSFRIHLLPDRDNLTPTSTHVNVLSMKELGMNFTEALLCSQNDFADLNDLAKLLNELLKRMVAQCVIHGDLHLNNVLLDQSDTGSWRLFLIDFSRTTFGFHDNLGTDLITVARSFLMANQSLRLPHSQLIQLVQTAFQDIEVPESLQYALARVDERQATYELERLYGSNAEKLRRDFAGLEQGRTPFHASVSVCVN
jgi:tRNA A-37 threonylcarbamoyl transferase component Bud32